MTTRHLGAGVNGNENVFIFQQRHFYVHKDNFIVYSIHLWVMGFC